MAEAVAVVGGCRVAAVMSVEEEKTLKAFSFNHINQLSCYKRYIWSASYKRYKPGPAPVPPSTHASIATAPSTAAAGASPTGVAG